MTKELSTWLDEDLLPALFERLPDAFPEFGWKKDGAVGWKATKAPAGISARADRIVCHKPHGLFIHGEGFQTWLSYANGGTKPTGGDFTKILRDLAKRVGLTLPEKEETQDAREKREKKEKERDLVEVMVRLCQRLLLESPEAEGARNYLKDRGLSSERWDLWELGFMPKDTSSIVQEAEAKGWKWEEAKAVLVDAGLLREGERGLYPHFYSRVVAPWRGPGGAVLTWWGRKLPGGKPEAPKYLYAIGEGRKAAPYLLNRSPKGGRLLLVEGVLDGIVCREHGFPAVALGGASLEALLPALKVHRPEGLTLALDPDQAGQDATRKAVAKLLEAGLLVFVVELPKGEKGEKLDPDAFLRTHGKEALERLVKDAPNALRWKARKIMDSHRGDGWTDSRTAAAIQDAVDLAGELPAVLHPHLPSTLFEELGQEIPLSPETMAEAAQTLQEKTEAERHERETKAHLEDLSKRVAKLLEDGRVLDARAILLEEAAVLRDRALKTSRPVPKVVLDELVELEGYLSSLRGRERVGLPLLGKDEGGELCELDEALMGLRGLMLVAGPPGTGKTSLAVQLGLEAMQAEPTSAVVLVSLEQSRWEHLTRNLAHFSRLPWKTVAMGSTKCRNPQDRAAGLFFQPGDLKKLKDGEKTLRELAPRFLILDDQNFPEPTAESIVLEVEKVKERTGAENVLVIVDYLQLWPVPMEAAKVLRTDLDRDKWQIGELKKLKGLLSPGDAVVAISEAKKADWAPEALGLGSVMGSARGSYTPDVVMVIQPVPPERLAPESGADGKPFKPDAAKAEGESRLRALKEKGVSLIRLEIVKGRDGVHRRGFDMAFVFNELRFRETSLGAELEDLGQ